MNKQKETAVMNASLETHISAPMSIRKEDLDLENPFNNFKYINRGNCDTKAFLECWKGKLEE